MVDFIIRLIVFALIHSLLAFPSLKKRIIQSFPRAGQFYRFTYNLIAVGTFFWAMATWHLSPVLYIVPGASSLLFHLAQLVCLIFLGRCASQTGIGDFLGFDQLRGVADGHHLVTSGCYGRVRHPLYSLSFIFLVLNPVMTLKWLVLTIFSTAYFALGAHFEEKRLIVEFGDSYRHYQEEVPMFFPRLKRHSEVS